MSKRFVVLSSIAALAVPAVAATPAGARGKGLFPCGTGGATPGQVSDIKARALSCADARAVVRSVEAHKQFCRLQKGTLAPFRICNVEVALPSGSTRSFHCVAQFENGTFFRERCSATGRIRVQYRRNYNAVP